MILVVPKIKGRRFLADAVTPVEFGCIHGIESAQEHRILELIVGHIYANVVLHDMTSDMIRNHLQTLFKMTELSHTEKATLACMSYLPHEGMPAQTFTDWCLQEDYDVITSLYNSGWITYRAETDYVSMHPLIADLLKDIMPTFFDKIEIFVTNLLSAEREKHDSNNPGTRDRYIPLALSLSEHVEDFPFQTWCFMHIENVGYIQSCGMLSATEETLCRILKRIEDMGFDSYLYCQAAYKLVGLYNQIAKYDEADQLLRNIMEKCQYVTTNNLSLIILCFLEASFLYALKGKLEISRALLQTTTELSVDMYPIDLLQTIDHRTLFKIGEIYRLQGTYDDALKAFNSALDMRLKMHGGESESAGLVYAQIGLTYRKMGRNAEAAEKLYKAFTILVKIYPDYHSDLLSIQLSLGVTLEEISGVDFGVSRMIDYLSGNISIQDYNDKLGAYLKNIGSFEKFCEKTLKPQKPEEAKTLKSSSKVLRALLHRWTMTVGHLSYKETRWLEHKREFNIMPNCGTDVPALLRYNYFDFLNLLRTRSYSNPYGSSKRRTTILHLSDSTFFNIRDSIEGMAESAGDTLVSNVSLPDFYRYLVDGKNYPLPHSDEFLRFHGLIDDEASEDS